MHLSPSAPHSNILVCPPNIFDKFMPVFMSSVSLYLAMLSVGFGMQTMLQELLTASATTLPSGDGDCPSLCAAGQSTAMAGAPLAAVDAPDRLVREAAQGHASVVHDVIGRHPDAVGFFSHCLVHALCFFDAASFSDFCNLEKISLMDE